MKKKLILPVAFAGLLLTACQAGGVTLAKEVQAPFNRFVGNKTDLQKKELALNLLIIGYLIELIFDK